MNGAVQLTYYFYVIFAAENRNGFLRVLLRFHRQMSIPVSRIVERIVNKGVHGTLPFAAMKEVRLLLSAQINNPTR